MPKKNEVLQKRELAVNNLKDAILDQKKRLYRGYNSYRKLSLQIISAPSTWKGRTHEENIGKDRMPWAKKNLMELRSISTSTKSLNKFHDQIRSTFNSLSLKTINSKYNGLETSIRSIQLRLNAMEQELDQKLQELNQRQQAASNSKIMPRKSKKIRDTVALKNQKIRQKQNLEAISRQSELLDYYASSDDDSALDNISFLVSNRSKGKIQKSKKRTPGSGVRLSKQQMQSQQPKNNLKKPYTSSTPSHKRVLKKQTSDRVALKNQRIRQKQNLEAISQQSELPDYYVSSDDDNTLDNISSFVNRATSGSSKGKIQLRGDPRKITHPLMQTGQSIAPSASLLLPVGVNGGDSLRAATSKQMQRINLELLGRTMLDSQDATGTTQERISAIINKATLNLTKNEHNNLVQELNKGFMGGFVKRLKDDIFGSAKLTAAAVGTVLLYSVAAAALNLAVVSWIQNPADASMGNWFLLGASCLTSLNIVDMTCKTALKGWDMMVNIAKNCYGSKQTEWTGKQSLQVIMSKITKSLDQETNEYLNKKCLRITKKILSKGAEITSGIAVLGAALACAVGSQMLNLQAEGSLVNKLPIPMAAVTNIAAVVVAGTILYKGHRFFKNFNDQRVWRNMIKAHMPQQLKRKRN